MTFAKLNLPRIPDAIAHQLETRILEGLLKPGDRLPAERELASELGVSRPSLREAIKKLVSRELLVSRHGGGTYVTDRLAATFSDPWQQLLDQHPSLQDDVLEWRNGFTNVANLPETLVQAVQDSPHVLAKSIARGLADSRHRA